jgi:hypothetical protein
MRAPTDREAFSATEEEFFRAGEAMAAVDGSELEEPPQQSLWARWFRKSVRSSAVMK